MPDELQKYKNSFLDKYNLQRTTEIAMARGIAAATQHNSLYRFGLSLEGKNEAKETWRNFLQSLMERYITIQSEETYEKDIIALKDLMNSKHSKAFNATQHIKYKTDPGFRLSHAQKSISVFLKHLWCMDKVAAPPQCPVDRIILETAGKRYKDTKWGYVNAIEEHRTKIDFLKDAKNTDQSLAEWELMTFNP